MLHFQLFSDYALEDLFEMEDEEYGTSPIHMLEHSYVDTIPTFADLQQWSTSKYPTLTDVTCSGIPLEWEFFSPLNLRTLRLCIGVRRAPSMVILWRILSNSMDTLECLELTDIIDLAAPSDPHPA